MVLILLGLIASKLTGSSAVIKEITICDNDSKEYVVGVNLYSKIQKKCFQTNIKGKVSFPVIEKDSIQFEYSGYDLLNLSAEDVLSIDTVYISSGKPVSLGTTGIKPFLEADNFRVMCKCCSFNKK